MNNDELLTGTVYELQCNLDDMTPEDIAFAMDVLLEAGALDVYTVSIGMKKNRPGTMLCCLCAEGERERFARLLLRHTTTLGVRMHACERMMLSRSVRTADTPYGPVRVKQTAGGCKPEYEDLARIAREKELPIRTVREEIAPYLKENT